MFPFALPPPRSWATNVMWVASPVQGLAYEMSPVVLGAGPFPANAAGMTRAAASTDRAARSRTFFTSFPS